MVIVDAVMSLRGGSGMCSAALISPAPILSTDATTRAQYWISIGGVKASVWRAQSTSHENQSHCVTESSSGYSSHLAASTVRKSAEIL